MNLKHCIVFILAIATLFVSCNNEDKSKNDVNTEQVKEDMNDIKVPEQESSRSLEGAWEIVRAEGIAAKTNVGTVYTFKGDELVMGKNGFNNPGKTEITDSTFSFVSEGIDYKFLYHYYFNGDTLVTSMENSKGQHFYMLKK